MSPFATESESAVEIVPLTEDGFGQWRERQPEAARRWLQAGGFRARPGTYHLMPDAAGGLERVLAGVEPGQSMWSLAHLPGALPAGVYRLGGNDDDTARLLAALGWGLSCYRFDRYKRQDLPEAKLCLPAVLRDQAESQLQASIQVRDWVNTPAEDLGPAELAAAAEALAAEHQARCRVIGGRELEQDFPAVHAVGRASSRPPGLIRLQWGESGRPRLALVGKGVIFDSGGLNIKPGSGMALMKKDMGGAAHVLALAGLIMRHQLPVDLRVYIPAVENAIAGNAYRPSDIIRTRKGTTVEIGNTDAEGRVVLADALTLACEEGAETVIDFATLTGAARVALGPDLPPLYTRDTATARRIQDRAFELEDPLWHMPLYAPYRSFIQPAIADLSNTGSTPQGGSLTAALFLDHFVEADREWMHLDIYAWNSTDRPGRPKGGEAQGLRAIWDWLMSRYG